MARQFSDVRLEAEQVTETHRTLNNDHTITEEELPGMVNVYLVIDGARLLFTQYKAGKVLDAQEQARQQVAAQQQATPPPADESQPAPPPPPPPEPPQA